LLDNDLVAQELFAEKYLAIEDLLGAKRVLQIINSDLARLKRAPKLTCGSCNRRVPWVEEIFCTCGSTLPRLPKER
jgi:hypothetical protein